jgi:hypothetical protein
LTEAVKEKRYGSKNDKKPVNKAGIRGGRAGVRGY